MSELYERWRWRVLEETAKARELSRRHVCVNDDIDRDSDALRWNREVNDSVPLESRIETNLRIKKAQENVEI